MESEVLKSGRKIHGQLSIKIGDESYWVTPTSRAVENIEQRLAKPLLGFLTAVTFEVRDIAVIMHEFLQAGAKKAGATTLPSEKLVYEWLDAEADDGGYQSVIELVSKAVQLWYSGADALIQEAPANAESGTDSKN